MHLFRRLLPATICLLSATASAQTSTPVPAPDPRGAAPSPPLPPALAEHDPMLEPPAPPLHVVPSWEEALAALRARSTDLRIALDEIERNEGLWRQTLASSLPQLTGTGSVTANLL